MAHNTELTFEDLATNYSKPLLAYIDFLRKNKKVQFAEFDEDSIPVDGDELDGLVVDEMSDCVRGVIDGLPPDYRAAIVLSNL